MLASPINPLIIHAMTACTPDISKIDARPRQPRRQTSPSPASFWNSHHESASSSAAISSSPIIPRAKIERSLVEAMLEIGLATGDDIDAARLPVEGHHTHSSLAGPSLSDKEPTKPRRQKSIVPDEMSSSSQTEDDEVVLPASKSDCNNDHTTLTASLLASYRRPTLPPKPERFQSW